MNITNLNYLQMDGKRRRKAGAFSAVIRTERGSIVRCVRQFSRPGDARNWAKRTFYEWPEVEIVAVGDDQSSDAQAKK